MLQAIFCSTDFEIPPFYYLDFRAFYADGSLREAIHIDTKTHKSSFLLFKGYLLFSKLLREIIIYIDVSSSSTVLIYNSDKDFLTVIEHTKIGDPKSQR